MAILTAGEPAPWFTTRSLSRPDFNFASLAGRPVVLSFIGSAGQDAARTMLEGLQARGDLFNAGAASLVLVSNDAQDESLRRLRAAPGMHVFWDHDGQVAALYGAARQDGDTRQVTLASFVLDPLLRIVRIVPVADPAAHAGEIAAVLGALPARTAGAPALLLPGIFEPEFCRQLIGLYEGQESSDSGFMRTDPASGKTVLVHDHAVKRRRDVLIQDEAVRQAIQSRLYRRLVPEIRKAFQFEATRIERYIVACYGARDGGHFRAHRDNTTRGTAHRRFAVTINLNAEEYDGGDLVFPEFSAATWRAPTGGAVVFSCSLLHEAQPVTRGTRFCFLPFLYDEAAARIRAENRKFVDLADEPPLP